MKRIYFNNAATTPLNKHVLIAILPYLTKRYGNPSGLDKVSIQASNAIEKARKQVANALGCDSDEIFFTSGASESNSWVAKCSRYKLVASNDSHSSLDKYKGSLNLELAKSEVYINEKPILYSCPLINNETGEINNFDLNVPVHFDLTQVLGKANINLHSNHNIKFASASAHKIGGLKGCGFLYIKRDEQPYIDPLIEGHQEKRLRGGTENVVGIVSLGKAIETVNKNMDNSWKKISKVIDYIVHKSSYYKKIKYNSNIINITFNNLNAQSAVAIFDRFNISVSAGSACNFDIDEPSKILIEAGYTEEEAMKTIRVSIGTQNTIREARKFVKICKKIIDKYDN